MNELEKALAGSNYDLDDYLENTSTDQFRSDIKNMMDKHADTAAFKEKVIDLINTL